jgi:hypothetical protein
LVKVAAQHWGKMSGNFIFWLLLTLPASTSAGWLLGGSGEDCAKACSGRSQLCSPSALHQRNSEVISEREVGALIERFHGRGNCTDYNLQYGSNTDVPAYDTISGICYVSDVFRAEKDFSCDQSPPDGK